MLDDQPRITREQLAANIAHVRSAIAEAAQRAGRSADEITLVAVSKTMPGELVQIAYNLGVTDFGENRVQEALPKIEAFHPHGIRLPVLLQVNVSGEASKEGMPPAQTLELARQVVELPAIQVEGLMTIAPLVEDPETVRPIFRELRLLRDRLRTTVPASSWRHLSMGMTDDYAVAIEEGATIVRIGRAIFGERVKK